MTKLTTVKRKANVGERILIVNAVFAGGQYENGRVAEVRKACDEFPERIVFVKEWSKPVHISEYRVFVEDDKDNARLTSAEAKIATLESEVAALRKAQKPKSTSKLPKIKMFTAEEFNKAMAKIAEASRRSVQTPNQRRADVIKRAQAFVADLERRAYDCDGEDGNSIFEFYSSRLSFHVNPEKRVVTALAHGSAGRLFDKAFARCHPDDVFNADIGKAIAAGKLYGVNYTMEFEYAPQPTEVVVGMKVRRYNRLGNLIGNIRVERVREASSGEFGGNPGETIVVNRYCGYTTEFGDRILEDTDAVYL